MVFQWGVSVVSCDGNGRRANAPELLFEPTHHALSVYADGREADG
jgi:hypothetical protein